MTEERNEQESERQTAYTFIERQKTEIARLCGARAAALEGDPVGTLLSPPPYFSAEFGYAGAIKTDYNCPKGFNCASAESMLNETVFSECRCIPEDAKFDIISFRRIENRATWERFRLHEHQVRQKFGALSPEAQAHSLALVPPSHPWFTALEAANGFSAASKTRYLLHGTKAENLGSISTNGLAVNCAGGSSFYGRGVYFAQQSCKACQYTCKADALVSDDRIRSIIVCRVALGNISAIPEACPDR
ncbi:hypothetical protein M885DRAFT_535405 [Pelagophyceae sp. CCMP2097]|nr:hypothetical protein M885DRAFT_535405 [Pelagophyceae sp. CCMP2097]|mmetsp:Transcript_27902/g.93904  ORF Transcript_27902/g.93904 Transcript_27902/m.93904 type:complete len:247 (+) Transcript_27902:264-1004(+)